MHSIKADVTRALVPGGESPSFIDFDLGGVCLKLRTDDRVFVPTLTTKIIASCLTIESGAEVLDLGCGSGRWGSSQRWWVRRKPQ